MSNSTHQNNANKTPELQLQLQNSERSDQQIRIKNKKTTIGSHDNCTVVLNSNSVQPVHCMLIQGSAGTVIRNFHADTRLNGESVGDAWFQAGDTVSVGNVDFQYPAKKPNTDQPNENASSTDANQATRELEQRTQQVMDLIERLGDLENELGQLKQSSSQLDEKATAFELQVIEKLNEVDRLEQQNADLMSRLEFTRQDRELIHDLEQKSEEIAARTVELESALEQKDNIIAQFASQNSSLASEVTELRTKSSRETDDVQLEDHQLEDDQIENLQHEVGAYAAESSDEACVTPEEFEVDVDHDSTPSAEIIEATQFNSVDNVAVEEPTLSDELSTDFSEEISSDDADQPVATFETETSEQVEAEEQKADSEETEDETSLSQDETDEVTEPVDTFDSEIELAPSVSSVDSDQDKTEACDETDFDEHSFENAFGVHDEDAIKHEETVDSEDASPVLEQTQEHTNEETFGEEHAANPFAVLDMIDQARSTGFQQADFEIQPSSEETAADELVENIDSEITDFQSLLKQAVTETADSAESAEAEATNDDLAAQWESQFRKEFLSEEDAAPVADDEVAVDELQDAGSFSEEAANELEAETITESTQECEENETVNEFDSDEQQQQFESSLETEASTSSEFKPLTDPFEAIRQEFCETEDEVSDTESAELHNDETAYETDEALDSEEGETWNAASGESEFQPLTDPFEAFRDASDESETESPFAESILEQQEDKTTETDEVEAHEVDSEVVESDEIDVDGIEAHEIDSDEFEAASEETNDADSLDSATGEHEFQPLTDPFEALRQESAEPVQAEASGEELTQESTETEADELEFDFALAESNLAGAFAELSDLDEETGEVDTLDASGNELEYTESDENETDEDADFSSEQTESFFEAMNEVENSNPYASFMDENEEREEGSAHDNDLSHLESSTDQAISEEQLKSFESIAGETFSEILSQSPETRHLDREDSDDRAFAEETNEETDLDNVETDSAEYSPLQPLEDSLEGMDGENLQAENSNENPAPQDESGEGEDSYIQEYMKKLLGNGEGPEPVMPVTPVAVDKEEKTPSLLEKTFEREIKERQELLKPSEFIPKSSAPEKNSNLQAMRELANQSARSAIETSSRKRKFEQQSTIVLVFAGICFFIGAVLAMLSKSLFSLYAIGSVVFFALTGVGAWYFFDLKNNTSSGSGNDSRVQPESAKKQSEPVVPEADGSVDESNTAN